MAINRIRLSNFKSFKDLDVELGKFNVFVGANASGKSNFIQIFRFIRDMTNHGIDNAISMQGGIEYLRNIKMGTSEDFSLEVTSDEKLSGGVPPKEIKKEQIMITVYETIYKIIIKFTNQGLRYERYDEIISHKGIFVKMEEDKKNKGFFDIKKNLGKGEISISNLNREINVNLILPDEVEMEAEDVYQTAVMKANLRNENLESGRLLLQSPVLFMPHILSDFSIYDIDPKLSKKATPITGKADLEEEGSNLAITLKNILENEDKRRKFSNLMRDVLPFVEDVGVEKFADKSLILKLREIYSENQYLPASFLSDGTIYITALIIALFFDRKPIIIIEEPERNIHPYLISKLINMMKEVSEEKQIIITTHNPEVIKHAGLKNIYLISRNKEGFSTISKPSEKEEVKIFLENEMGIEELYVQNLLEI